MNIQDAVKIPYELYEEAFLTGSYYICNPPVMNTDIDFVIYTEEKYNLHVHLVNTEDFKSTSPDEGYGENYRPITTYRKGNFNLIVTDDSSFFDKFKIATEVAKKLNLKEKEQRVALFQYIVDGIL